MNRSLLNLIYRISEKPYLYLENKKNLSELYYIIEGFSIAYIYENCERELGIIPNFGE